MKKEIKLIHNTGMFCRETFTKRGLAQEEGTGVWMFITKRLDRDTLKTKKTLSAFHHESMCWLIKTVLVLEDGVLDFDKFI